MHRRTPTAADAYTSGVVPEWLLDDPTASVDETADATPVKETTEEDSSSFPVWAVLGGLVVSGILVLLAFWTIRRRSDQTRLV